MGERVRPLGVIYYSAGELHGMRNVGTVPATSLVFEFHTPTTVTHHRRRPIPRQKAKQAERARRKAEEQRRKRGLRGLLRRLVRAVKKRLR